MNRILGLGSSMVFLLAIIAAFPGTANEGFDCASVTEISQLECEALVALYNSTDGPNWTNNTNWLVTNTPSTWYGVTWVDPDYRIVNELILVNNNLSGSIPPELGNLRNLMFLNLRGNKLTGDVPNSITNLVNLSTWDLDLSFNYLNVPDGYPDPSIPLHVFLYEKDPDWHLQQYSTVCPQVTEIPQIECEALMAFYSSTYGNGWADHTNWLVTNTPSNWHGVTVGSGHVIRLDLHNNALMGTIPPELGNLGNLLHLNLSENELSSISPGLGNLSNLNFLILSFNHFSEIPPDLGNLSSLNYLDLSYNELSEIPIELSNLDFLEHLELSYNQLSGSIPPELGRLSKLWLLDLSHNQLSGSIPPELGNLSFLGYLILSYNQLSDIPAELGNLSRLGYLYLSNNGLSEIPAEFGNLGFLGYLDLSHNRLGKIPVELSNLALLGHLDLSYNELSEIPAELSNLDLLEYLDLSYNQLSGSIPPELGSLGRLKYLFLSYNQLSGAIPIEFGNLSNLIYLILAGNLLNESIPSELGHLTSLQVLWLQNNQLSGSIPPELGNLVSLQTLYLEHNQFVGDVPDSFVNLVNIYDGWGLTLGNNFLNVPPGYPDPSNPLHVFLSRKDPEWHLSQYSHFCLTVSEIPDTECEALQSLYNSTDGPNWVNNTNWLETNTPSNWYGVTVESGHVTALVLDHNLLMGSIPPEMYYLSSLYYLSLDHNQLSGTIPGELCFLSSLMVLRLNNNQLTGDIPLLSELVHLANPGGAPDGGDGLDLDYNALNIPDRYPSRFIWLHVFLSEKDPEWHLRQFFSCGYVSEIAQLECEALVALYDSTYGQGWLDNSNWLSTTWTSDWYGVTVDSGHVIELYLELNGLSGSIPVELGNLSNLSSLDMNENQLSGHIPPELGNLSNLRKLDLDSNLLSGIIPPQLGNLSSLQYLYLDHNRLSGTIPTTIGNLGSLEGIYLNNNQLSGPIPTELSNLNNLWYLYMDNNQLSGSIPVELGNLDSLWYLSLSNNQLSGVIPAEFGKLSSLQELDLSNNLIGGSVPIGLGGLANLRYLNLSNNQLGEAIPGELGNLNSLEALRLNRNRLTGDIPSSFINLTNLNDPGAYWDGGDGLDLDYNLLNIPDDYPDPDIPLHLFLMQKDPTWQVLQAFTQTIGSTGGTLTSLDGRTELVFPAGALITDTLFTFTPQPVPNYSPARLAFAHNSFQLSAVDTTGDKVITFTLPVTVTLSYTDADIFSIIEDTLGLYYWDSDANAWVDALSTCAEGAYTRDLDTNTFSLPICHLSEFAVLGQTLQFFIPLVQVQR